VIVNQTSRKVLFMKAIRLGALVALLLITAAVVLASPAFATPNITASSGTVNGESAHRAGAVAPFITPSGDTIRSSITFTGTGSSFRIGSFSVTCVVTGSGYVTVTHTQVRITTISFTGCTDTFGGRPTVDSSCANSVTPWFLHVKTLNAGSSTGTVNICRVSILLTSPVRCTYTVGPQSVDVTFTNTDTSLTVNDASVANTLDAGSSGLCPTGAADQRGVITARTDTRTDDLRVTPTSSP
jgi:hypothetical protein